MMTRRPRNPLLSIVCTAKCMTLLSSKSVEYALRETLEEKQNMIFVMRRQIQDPCRVSVDQATLQHTACVLSCSPVDSQSFSQCRSKGIMEFRSSKIKEMLSIDADACPNTR
ncbi:hypothetical protein CGRA01v4_03648 [Colletotrichum graminicola]|nr:hypothetical protein CGRA01v4_03648 [Colletotrichum graminicola]